MHTFHPGTMTAIATRTLYEIAPGAPVRWIAHAAGQARVRAGRIWLTREGEAWDHWLEAGGMLPVAAGDVFWASVEGEAPGRIEMRERASPAPSRRRAWRAWLGAAGVGAGRPA